MINITIASKKEQILAQLNQYQSLIKAEIKTLDDLSSANDLLAAIKEFSTNVENARKAMVEPLNKQVKAINSEFKTLSEPIDAVIKEFSTKLIAANREILEPIKTELNDVIDTIDNELSEADVDDMYIQQMDKQRQELIAKTEAARGVAYSAKTSVTERWTYEIESPLLLCKSRPDLAEPCRGAIRKAVNAGEREIAGLRIYKEEGLTLTKRGC